MTAWNVIKDFFIFLTNKNEDYFNNQNFMIVNIVKDAEKWFHLTKFEYFG